MASESTWKELLQILCPRGAGIFDEVSLAMEDPEGYFEEYQEELSGRGIREPSSVSPWLAMIDGLASRNCLVEVDWKEAASELMPAIEGLTPCRERKIDLSSLEESTATPEKLFPAICKILNAQQLTLASPLIDSDSYPLVVIPVGSSSRILELVELLGEQFKIFKAA